MLNKSELSKMNLVSRLAKSLDEFKKSGKDADKIIVSVDVYRKLQEYNLARVLNDEVVFLDVPLFVISKPKKELNNYVEVC